MEGRKIKNLEKWQVKKDKRERQDWIAFPFLRSFVSHTFFKKIAGWGRWRRISSGRMRKMAAKP